MLSLEFKKQRHCPVTAPTTKKSLIIGKPPHCTIARALYTSTYNVNLMENPVFLACGFPFFLTASFNGNPVVLKVKAVSEPFV